MRLGSDARGKLWGTPLGGGAVYEVLGNLRNLVEPFLVTVWLCAAESLILLRTNPVSEKRGGSRRDSGLGPGDVRSSGSNWGLLAPCLRDLPVFLEPVGVHSGPASVRPRQGRIPGIWKNDSQGTICTVFFLLPLASLTPGESPSQSPSHLHALAPLAFPLLSPPSSPLAPCSFPIG